MGLFKDQNNHQVDFPVVLSPEVRNGVVHKILQWKIAFQQYILTLDGRQEDQLEETLETQLNRLAWRHKLLSVEIISVAAEELRKSECLPVWARRALAEGQLYLLAYRFSSISQWQSMGSVNGISQCSQSQSAVNGVRVL